MTKKVLITGGAGFIGSHLAEELIDRGDEVIIVDNFSTGSMSNIRDIENKIAIIRCNIEEFSIEKYPELSNIDEVYHLAACVGVKKVLEDPLGCINSNMHGLMNVLDILMIAQKNMQHVPRLFFASTSEVYGKNEKWALNEEDDRITGSTQKKRWIYAETKAIDEMICNIYVEQFKLDIVIARFFSIVGPRQSARYGMVLPQFVEQALKDEPITVYGDGTQIRSFMHVHDCIESVIRLMRDDISLDTSLEDRMLAHGVYNIGSREPIMIKDLAKWVRHYANSSSQIHFVPYHLAYDGGFEDMRRRVPCLDKATNAGILMQENLRNIDDIIKDTIEFYRSKA